VHLRRIAVPSALTLALTLVVAPVADAKLPAPKVTTVVVGKSVAGVKLGMTLTAAKQKWGAGSKCGAAAAGPGATQCTWSNSSSPNGAKLILLGIGGKVRAIVVDGGPGGAAIEAFRTTKGIGIGSTTAALKAAHPGLANTLGPDNPSLGSGATMTSFYVKGGHVRSLQVGTP
jgi:hypothetical protein